MSFTIFWACAYRDHIEISRSFLFSLTFFTLWGISPYFKTDQTWDSFFYFEHLLRTWHRKRKNFFQSAIGIFVQNSRKSPQEIYIIDPHSLLHIFLGLNLRISLLNFKILLTHFFSLLVKYLRFSRLIKLRAPFFLWRRFESRAFKNLATKKKERKSGKTFFPRANGKLLQSNQKVQRQSPIYSSSRRREKSC